MEKKEYLIPETTLFYPETESAILQDSLEVDQGEDNGEVEAKKLTDKLFDDEEEL